DAPAVDGAVARYHHVGKGRAARTLEPGAIDAPSLAPGPLPVGHAARDDEPVEDRLPIQGDAAGAIQGHHVVGIVAHQVPPAFDDAVAIGVHVVAVEVAAQNRG